MQTLPHSQLDYTKLRLS